MSLFRFKHFSVEQEGCAMKVGTDSMIFGAWLEVDPLPKTILDVGTGTGVLSLMMAQKYPHAEINAVEIDTTACQVAQANFRTNQIGENCSVWEQDFLVLPEDKKYDVILSNPPFFENALKSGIEQKDKARHTDSLPLSSFFEKSSRLLADGGALALILPVDTMDKYKETITDFYVHSELTVYATEALVKRTCVVFRKYPPSKMKKQSLVVREKNGMYSDAYIELTKEFHGTKLKKSIS